MFFQYIIILFLAYYNIISAFSQRKTVNNKLSVEQVKTINSIIINPSTNTEIRSKINKILYIYYEKWAINQAYTFKKLHKFKCRQIKIDELQIYSLKGLIDGIKNYNGKSNFLEYIKIYIEGCLFEGMTELQPLTIIPKHIRRNSNWSSKNKKRYKKSLKPIFYGLDDWLIDKNIYNENTVYITNEKYNLTDDYISNIWMKIYNLDDFSKNVFYYKYNYNFDKIRSNKNISKLLNCSEETIRKNLKKSKTIITNYLLENNFNTLQIII
jgi:hypothetical protein